MEVVQPFVEKAEAVLNDFLIKTYPNCFDINDKKPLKVGIANELVLLHQDKIKKRLIKKAIDLYCNRIDYLESFSKYNDRIDLQGNKVAELKKEALDYSLKRLNNKRKAEQVALLKAEQLKAEQEALRIKEELEAKKAANKRPTLSLRGKRPKS